MWKKVMTRFGSVLLAFVLVAGLMSAPVMAEQQAAPAGQTAENREAPVDSLVGQDPLPPSAEDEDPAPSALSASEASEETVLTPADGPYSIRGSVEAVPTATPTQVLVTLNTIVDTGWSTYLDPVDNVWLREDWSFVFEDIETDGAYVITLDGWQQNWFGYTCKEVTVAGNDVTGVQITTTNLWPVSGKVDVSAIPGLAAETLTLNTYSYHTEPSWLSPQGGRWAQVNADGTYTLYLEDGDWEIQVANPGTPPYFKSSSISKTVAGAAVPNVNFTLSRGRSVSGKLSLPDGAEMSDHSVQLEEIFRYGSNSWGTSSRYPATLDEDGSFTIGGLDDGEYLVAVYSVEDVDVPTSAAFKYVAVNGSDISDADIAVLPARYVSGKITAPAGVDKTTLMVSASAIFALPDGDENYLAVGSTQPDSQGNYRVLAAAGRVNINVMGTEETNPAVLYANRETLVGDTDPTGVDITVSTGYKISGRIEAYDGANLSGAELTLYDTIDGSHRGYTTTLSNGSFSFYDPVPDGRYRIQINNSDSRFAGYGNFITHYVTVTDDDVETVIDITQPNTISGTLSADFGNIAYENLNVYVVQQVYDPNSGYQNYFILDEDHPDENGEYTLEVGGMGEFIVCVEPSKTGPGTSGPYVAGYTTQVNVTSASEVLDIRLQQGYTVSGKVTGFSGLNLTNVKLRVNPGNYKGPVEFSPDKNGNFALPVALGSGYQYLEVLAAETAPYYGAQGNSFQINSAPVSGLKFTLAKGYRLTGSVTVPEGQSKQYLSVQLYQYVKNDFGYYYWNNAGSTTTDAYGNYAFTASNGDCTISVAPPHGSTGLAYGQAKVTIKNKNVTAPVINIVPGHTISGQVETLRGQSAEGITVALNDGMGLNFHQTVTDENGRFSFRPGFLDGDYNLSVNYNYEHKFPSYYNQTVTVAGGDVSNAHLLLDRAYTVAGKLQAAENTGLGVSGVPIYLYAANGMGWVSSCATDDDGNFVFETGIAAGEYYTGVGEYGISQGPSITVANADLTDLVIVRQLNRETRKTPQAADIAATLPADGIYTGAPFVATITPADNAPGLGTVKLKYNGADTPPTEAGVYEVTADVTETKAYTAAQNIVLGSFTIAKAAPTQALFEVALPAAAVYNSQPHSAAVSVLADVQGLGSFAATYTGVDGTSYPESETPPVAAGKYRVALLLDEGQNYSAGRISPLEDTFTIDAAPGLGIAPTVSGVARVGKTLTASLPAIGDGDYIWQWYRGEDAIPGANQNSYTLAPADEGRFVWVRATSPNPNIADKDASSLRVWVQAALTEKAYGFRDAVNTFTFLGKNQAESPVPLVDGHGTAGLYLKEYKSSKTSVFTVDKTTGNLTLMGVGTAELTAVWTDEPDGKGEVFTDVTVIKVLNNLQELGATLNATKLTLQAGKGASLSIRYNTKTISILSTEWASDNETVAKVDANGKVTTFAPGTANLSVKIVSVDGPEDTLVCPVTVLRAATGITIDDAKNKAARRLVPQGYENFTLGDACEVDLTATVLPTDTTDKVTWSVNNDKLGLLAVNGGTPAKTVVAETDDTITLITLKSGSVTVTAQAGSKKASQKFTIQIPSTRVEFNAGKGDASLTLNVNEAPTLAATVFAKGDPTDKQTYLAPANKKLVWTSSDPLFVTVNSSGRLKALRPTPTGEPVTITATAADNEQVVATCEVTVVAPLKEFKFNQQSFKMAASTGEALSTATLSFTYNKGAPVTPSMAAITLEIPNTTAMEFEGGATDAVTGKHTITVPYGTPVVVQAKTMDPNKEVATKITATAAGARACTLTVTVSTKPLVAVTGLYFANEGKAPGTTVATQLATGKSFVPSVKPRGVGSNGKTTEAVSNRSVEWAITCSDSSLVWGDYVDFDFATGKVTAIKPLPEDKQDATFLVTGYPAGNPANVIPAWFRFKVKQMASRLTIGLASAADSSKIAVGESTNLAVSFAPDNVTYTGVKWTSSNAKIATVSTSSVVEGGTITVTGVKGGSATITATAQDGSGKRASFKVTVGQQLNDIVISSAEQGTELWVNRNSTLKLAHKLNAQTEVNTANKIVALSPQPAVKTVRWVVVEEYSSANPGTPAEPGSIVSLNAKNGQVKGLADGYALIRVVPADEDDSYTCSNVGIHKKNKDGSFAQPRYANTVRVNVKVTAASVSLQQSNFKMHSETAAAFTLNATTTPLLGQLTGSERQLKWVIANPAAVEFDTAKLPAGNYDLSEDGKTLLIETGSGEMYFKTKVQTGTAAPASKITVTTGSNRSASLTVTACAKEASALAVERIAPVKGGVWLAIGGKANLAVNFTPKTPGNKNLTWAIEEAYSATDGQLDARDFGSIATINAKTGQVTARGSGHVIITATSHQNPDATATFTVYVNTKA